MRHSSFVHLHLHSQYSLLDGAIRPEALIARAREFRMPAVAVTDHGNIFGAVEFHQKAMAGGVKPIIGCEVYVAPGRRTDRTPPSRGGSHEAAFHLVLLVKNAIGYRNLCRLLSAAYTEGFYYRPRIDKELLAECSEGLIALSACLHGEVSYNVAAGRSDAALEAAAFYKGIFPDRRFYLELQSNGMEEQARVNRALLGVGRDLGIPVVATNDCHYLDRKDARVHDILLCIQTGATVNSPDRMRFATDEFYLKSPEEMAEAFRDVPEALANTVEIAERCNFEFRLGEHHLPAYPVPPGQTLDGLIEDKARAGLEKRLGAGRPAQDGGDGDRWRYHERLEKELKVIEGMGFSGYFLIVADFIDYARGIGIPVGPGRGSAAGSLVAYSLGITNLDPIRYNLLFERFLNPDRISLPDIDIDFCFERRDEVIRYVTGKYGQDNVTQIITFGQMKARACIRDVGRALDMPYGEVDRIAKLVPAQLNITIDAALKEEPRLKRLCDEDPRVMELIEAARALEGLPRHASTHAAGVVISNRPIVEYLPLYKGQKENIVTTQFPMNDVEKIGLVKFDFLGLKTLTVMDRTVKLAAMRGAALDLDTLDLSDARTYAMMASGATDGVFQLESSGMKDVLRKLKPECFEDVIAAVALYRPGPLQSGMVDDFINRRHKRVPIKYEVDSLKGILENTYGVMVYQEQVMEIARTLAGFTPGEADVLRKAMGKKRPEEMLVQRSKFLDGARKSGVPAKKAEKIFDLMAKFAGYGFNKSHSAAYALIAFQTAFLKTHYPVEFMAALLSSDMGSTDQVVKYINECRVLGIGLDPPDVNLSSMEFTVSEGRIRFGLGAIKNVGSAAIEEILSVREAGPFASLVDFLSRVDSRKLNRKVVESLIKCGAFDSTGVHRAALLDALDGDMDTAQGVQRDRDLGQKSIFDVIGRPPEAPAVRRAVGAVAGTPAFDARDMLRFEKETLGFYLTSHPLDGLVKDMEARTSCRIAALPDRADGEDVTIAGVAAGVKEIMTKKGERMAFVRLEDLSGSVEVVVFAEIFRKNQDLILSDRPLIVRGRLDSEDEGVKVVASEVAPFEGAARRSNTGAQGLHITARSETLDGEKLAALKGMLDGSPGSTPVFLHILYPDGREVLLSPDDRLRVDPAGATLVGIKGLIDGVEVRLN
jgi:DNA polymerase-3 subunit alpha